MTSTQETKEQVQQTAGTAADEGKHVAAVVGEEAQNVAGQAKDQMRGLLDEALGQVSEQSRTQLERLVGTLQSVTTDLESMASSADSGLAAQLTQQVADRSRSLGTHLEGREPSEVLDDVRQFAGRRPGLFLLGALGAGVVVGRLARGAKQAHSQDTASSSTTGTPEVRPTPTLTGDPRSSGTSAAPSYGQPVIAVPNSPVEPTYPGGVGAVPASPLADELTDENGASAGPQGFLP
ncbi:hypothetical protein GCM10023350_31100 [Nocardioides endophyticus]|uniref:DUF3618 domain-containing protein n=1 Tax=Nocardioides endophyticus TaxID=1353775 RepID=A0ABP8Z1Z8_9ACTN